MPTISTLIYLLLVTAFIAGLIWIYWKKEPVIFMEDSLLVDEQPEPVIEELLIMTEETRSQSVYRL